MQEVSTTIYLHVVQCGAKLDMSYPFTARDSPLNRGYACQEVQSTKNSYASYRSSGAKQVRT